MTDSRAALEERAHKFILSDRPWEMGRRDLADFAEQESSSLKLLLSAIIEGDAWINQFDRKCLCIGDKKNCGRDAAYYEVELDSSGIPVLTQEIIEALEATK